ncbi:hypothetical protein [Cardiobacterium valvarum]|uniref:hypothetical protein n=1 Tax=Cardiobacterium valvarum TaxID=194702 RepID=UPI001C10D0DB|nr:hypothetical protein [Cardiobacterium valvarum]
MKKALPPWGKGGMGQQSLRNKSSIYPAWRALITLNRFSGGRHPTLQSRFYESVFTFFAATRILGRAGIRGVFAAAVFRPRLWAV